MKHDVEWQKRIFANILIWLVEIDKIISAEIPDPNVDQEFFDIVTININRKSVV